MKRSSKRYKELTKKVEKILYSPEEAVNVWIRMSANGKNSTPEFLSTHPSDATRIANLKSLIPQARETAAKVGIIRI